jgi:hypothetical protein
MMRQLVIALIALGCAGCTDVGTNPNAIVAVRFDGSAYPSIVAGDSLRDSLGTIQPLQAVGLNYKNEPVEGAPFVFSSPDTILRMFASGVVFARGRKADGVPARVFAAVQALQSQPDSLFVVPRADSIAAGKTVDTVPVSTEGTGVTAADSLPFFVRGDTVAGAPKVAVPAWLVSFQLRYKGTLLAPNDTSVAYTFVTTATTPPRRLPSFIDSTDASGRVSRQVVIQQISAGLAEDTIFIVATARPRKPGAAPLRAETMILLRRP